VFDVSDEGFGVVLKPSPGPEHDAEVADAIASCPERAISATWTADVSGSR
jgi:ferredoxin